MTENSFVKVVSYLSAWLKTQEQQSAKLRATVEGVRSLLATHEESRVYLIDKATSTQTLAVGVIEKIVNAGLDEVFGDIRIRLDFQEKRGEASVEIQGLRKVSSGWEIEDLLKSEAGGHLDLIAFLLRLAAIILTTSSNRLMLLDEPFRMVSEEYRPKVASLMRALVDKFNFQIILVTHQADFAEVADKVVCLGGGVYDAA